MYQDVSNENDLVNALVTAANNEALLREALSIAQNKTLGMERIVNEILKTGKIEGACKLQPNLSTISFEVKKYSCAWVISLPWPALADTTPEQEAEFIIETVIRNLHMTEADSWPKNHKAG